MTDSMAREIIQRKKEEYGESLIILCHHYQSDDIIAYADFIGDSLELARKASRIGRAEHVVFCGVYFMAESAAILAPGKSVYIPDRDAGCPLADMAPEGAVLKAWDALKEIADSVIPVSYVNSSAAIKAFCGRNSGTICTSGNALKVFEWAYSKADRIFFLPDMNLGRNTARGMGIPDDLIALWDPEKDLGGLDEETLMKARIILWKGWCPVHWPRFTPEDVSSVRAGCPGIRVIVHPETDPRTVAAADMSGSTANILNCVSRMSPGESLAIGTEANMVKRAASANPQLRIVPLKEVYCDDMARITMEKLADTLLHLEDDTYRVSVPGDTARHAFAALANMLKI
ncbi:MAG TPA: quinolinate synthase NadA [Deltaproteobacteria bacterium]|nr:quinolinate synthase NadA [Deltaproteobacteria bacterium]